MYIKKSSLFWALFTIILLFLLFLILKYEPQKKENTQQHAILSAETTVPRRNAIVKAIENVLPAVVNIGTERISGNTGNNQLLQQLFDSFIRSQKQVKTFSLGSGFIIDPSGLIVTNAHVVTRATKINITTANGEISNAEIIAMDSINDIALLHLTNPPEGLKTIRCDNSGQLYLGETVIAVGNPFGLDSSVTVGTLSGKKRRFSYKGELLFSDIIQTDANVYPGNSGGPLINIHGEVIGMNMSAYENAPGIGFAIPLARIENVIAKWMIPERLEQASLGIIPGIRKNQETGLQEIIVADVLENTPASKAGIRKGIILEQYNGKKIYDLLDLSREMIRLKSGDKVTFKTSAGKYTLKLVPLDYDPLTAAKNKLSLDLTPLTPALAEELDLSQKQGLLVSGLTHDTPPGIKRGDILIQINEKNITSPGDLKEILKQLHYGDTAEASLLTTIPFRGSIYQVKQKVRLPVR